MGNFFCIKRKKLIDEDKTSIYRSISKILGVEDASNRCFNGQVMCLLKLPGDIIAAGHADGNISTAKYYEFRESVFKGYDCVFCLIKLPGNKFASCSNIISVWQSGDDYKSGERISTFSDQNESIRSLLLLPDGKIVSGSLDKSICIYQSDDDYITNKCIGKLTEHNGGVVTLLLLPDGKFASGSKDKTIKIWQSLNGYVNNKCESSLIGHEAGVNYLLLMPCGKIASGSDDLTIKLWKQSDERDNNIYECCLTLITGHTKSITSLLLLQHNILVSSSFDKTIKIWQTNDKGYYDCKMVSNLTDSSSGVSSLLLLSDGKFASSDGYSIKIWSK